MESFLPNCYVQISKKFFDQKMPFSDWHILTVNITRFPCLIQLCSTDLSYDTCTAESKFLLTTSQSMFEPTD